jgi:hypothetical protein
MGRARRLADRTRAQPEQRMTCPSKAALGTYRLGSDDLCTRYVTGADTAEPMSTRYRVSFPPRSSGSITAPVRAASCRPVASNDHTTTGINAGLKAHDHAGDTPLFGGDGPVQLHNALAASATIAPGPGRPEPRRCHQPQTTPPSPVGHRDLPVHRRWGVADGEPGCPG